MTVRKYDPWTNMADRQELASRFIVGGDEILRLIQAAGYPLYTDLDEADVRELLRSTGPVDPIKRAWRNELSHGRTRANKRCAGQRDLLAKARDDFFDSDAPPFPHNASAAREWVRVRYGESLELPDSNGVAWDGWDRPDIEHGPEEFEERSADRLRAWANVLAAAADVTQQQAVAYLLTGDVCAAEPPTRVAVVQSHQRGARLRITAEVDTPSEVVAFVYRRAKEELLESERSRPSPREAKVPTLDPKVVGRETAWALEELRKHPDFGDAIASITHAQAAAFMAATGQLFRDGSQSVSFVDGEIVNITSEFQLKIEP